MNEPPVSRLAAMHPAYFAMAMATGIVSIACHLLEYHQIAMALFWLNIVIYTGLWLALAIRVVQFPSRVLADLSSHGRAVGFFTMVAATCVLGTQLLIIGKMPAVARVLWFVGIALWAGLTYVVFTILTVKREKPTLAEGINGGWLVAIVAAQSVSVLGSQLASSFAISNRPIILFFTLVMWLGAGMLYIWIISLIFYRYTFFTLSPSDLTPPYWINMGAVAISTLAGTMLIANAESSSILLGLLPFLKGMTLLFWATATWWIPMLLILGVWRHGIQRFPLRYDPLYWGAVFPLGMYTACSVRLSATIEIPFLMVIPRAFVFVALAAWLLTVIGLVSAFIPRPHADSI